MKITQDVRDYAAQIGMAPEDALESGLREKSAEFVRSGSELYQKT